MKKFTVNTADASHKDLVAIAVSSGFVTYEGGKHTKVKTKSGEFIAEVPRHSPINKHTVKNILKAMNAHGANIEIN